MIAAPTRARTKLKTIVMRDGIKRFMLFYKYIMRVFWLNSIHYMYFIVLLQYNAVVTGGVSNIQTEELS